MAKRCSDVQCACATTAYHCACIRQDNMNRNTVLENARNNGSQYCSLFFHTVHIFFFHPLCPLFQTIGTLCDIYHLKQKNIIVFIVQTKVFCRHYQFKIGTIPGVISSMLYTTVLQNIQWNFTSQSLLFMYMFVIYLCRYEHNIPTPVATYCRTRSTV